MKVTLHEREHGQEMVVEVRQDNWDVAGKCASDYRESPPDGYKLVRATIQRRSNSGRGANLNLVFVYCDSRVDMFTVSEANDFFRVIEPFKGPKPKGVEET